MQKTSTPNGRVRPQPTKSNLSRKKDWEKEREAKQRNAPIRKQERNDLRCNTDPQTNKRRTRRKNSTNEPGNAKDNKDNKEITRPEAAITWGRRKKRHRENQKKDCQEGKEDKKGKEI